MYPISALYDLYLKKPDREFVIKAEIDGVNFDETSVVDFEIENSLTIDEEFQLGTTTLSKLTMHIRTPQNIPQGAKIKPYISLGQEGLSWAEAAFPWQDYNVSWSNGQAEWLPLGEFYVDQREQINNVWTLICYDKLVFADELYLSSLSYPATMQAVWNEICMALGYAYDSSVVINPAYQIQAAPVGYSKRQVMGFIASANSASVFVGKDGKVKFKRWSAAAAPVATFTTSDYVRVKQTNPIKTYTRIVMHYDPDEADAFYEAGTGDDGHTLYVDNPLATQAICNALYASLNGFSYMPVQMDARGYPQYEHGDIIGFEKQEGTTWAETIVAWQDANFTWDNIATYKTIMLHTVLTYRGGLKMTVEAQAKSEQASEYEQDGPLTQEINRVNQTAVKQGKLYYGVSLSKEEGLVIDRSDNLSKVVLNSDEFTMWAESEKALYFDVPSRRFKFTGVVEGSSFIGGNIEIGSGSNVFKADESGIWAGHSSFGSAPFSVDMTGHLFAFNASIQGTIDSSTITGSNIFSPYIATQNGSFPRVELNSTVNLLRAMKDSTHTLDMLNLPTFDVPGLRFWDQSLGRTAYIYYDSSTPELDIIAVNGNIQLSAAASILINAPNVYIKGVDVISAIGGKADKSSRSGVIYVASTPGGPANVAINVASGVLQ